MGQFVTPQKRAISPTAAQTDGEKPVKLPNVHPSVAPMKKDGTISPPRKPASIVIAVKIIFITNAYGTASPGGDRGLPGGQRGLYQGIPA